MATENLKALIEAGADILAKDESGWTVVDHEVLVLPSKMVKLRMLVNNISNSDRRAADALANARKFAEENRLDEAIEIIDSKLSE